MKVSIIIAVYKNIAALDLIIQALKKQTYKNFEVVIVEDCAEVQMSEYVRAIKGLDVKHTSQEDLGIRKAKSQNNGILTATGEYLIFIDGDCIPYSTFIAGHVSLAESKCVLSGRRVNLNEKITQRLLRKEQTSLALEKNYLFQYELMFDKSTKYEQGIYFRPDGFFYNKIFGKKARNTSLLGCNFSCFKKDIVAINGFDEGYGGTALSDDTDLEWRFKAYGLSIKSCKNVANVFHLYHSVIDRGDPQVEIARMEENKLANRFVCKQGLYYE